MNLFEQVLAGTTAAACVLLLLRLCLGAARQQRVDRAVLGMAWALRRKALHLWRWRATHRAAQSEAQAAIQRARTGRKAVDGDDGEWTGNVYTPKSFRKPRKPDKLH